MSEYVPVQSRSDLHLSRKFWHATMGCLLAGIYFVGMPKIQFLFFLGLLFSFEVSVEWWRLRNPSVNAWIIRMWAPLMRGDESKQMSTIPHYLAASFLAVCLFPKSIALLSILFLALGDPIASVVGIRFGHLLPRFRNGKSILGTVAGVSVCSAMGLWYYRSIGLEQVELFILSLLSGTAGGIAELLPIDLDDNFVIPIFSGCVLCLVTAIFRVPF
jgi:dolichol kinase